ncbi:hypothetical protein KC345_g2725 [Hortaea werneckii]|nr:hypothetical protein KC345_g2725 [Hortaea werneckii]
MGDPFSIAVGALQVAEVGFKLCDTLHSSVQNFKNAEKDVKRVAGEVKTASWALKQLGALLQQDEAIKRTTPGAILEASTALDQCSEAFAEVQIILPAAGSDSTASISAATRFKWATRKSKVDALLANLERLKTTLVLVFKVISYAKEIASTSKDSATDQMDMRFQLETLIKSKNEAVRRYEELVKSLNKTRLGDDSKIALGLNAGSQGFPAVLKLISLPSNHASPAQGNTNVRSPAPKPNTADKNCETRDLSKGLTETLADCHRAAVGLSECLHAVHIEWRAVQKYNGDEIWNNYQLTNEAMRALDVVQATSLKTLSLPQTLGQETPNPGESTQAPVAAAGESKEKLTEPQETGTPSATDGSNTVPTLRNEELDSASSSDDSPSEDSEDEEKYEHEQRRKRDSKVLPPPPPDTESSYSSRGRRFGLQKVILEDKFGRHRIAYISPKQQSYLAYTNERLQREEQERQDTIDRHQQEVSSTRKDLSVDNVSSLHRTSGSTEDPVDALLKEWTTVEVC